MKKPNIIHAVDTTRTYAAALCGASAREVTRFARRATCKRCRAKLGLAALNDDQLAADLQEQGTSPYRTSDYDH